MERDVRTIFWIQALRAFVYGLATVIVGSGMHLSTGQVGLFVTAMLVGMPLVSLAVGTWGERIGRRRLYTTLFLVLAAAGAVPAFTAWLPLLIIAALTGTLSPDPNESGPITSLEQAMLGQAPAAVRTRVFGRYNAVAYLAGALGALAAGGPHALRHLYPHLPADQRWLVVFPVVGLICAFLASRLSEHVEAEPFEGPAVPRRPCHGSHSSLYT